MKDVRILIFVFIALILVFGFFIFRNTLVNNSIFENYFNNYFTDSSVEEEIANSSRDFEENISEIETKDFVDKNEYWRERIELALAHTSCLELPRQEFPDNYYTGPLTDAHLHIPAIPDWPIGEQPDNESLIGRFEGPEAYLGFNIKMSEIACTIKNEGTHKNFAFFPVYDEDISSALLEIWDRTMKEYPEYFTSFIMSSGDDENLRGFPTVDSKTLNSMLRDYPSLFKGYGEIGLYERENGGSRSLSPDSKMLKDIYHVVRGYDLAVYFHLGEGQKNAFEKVLSENPDINFVWHGDQLSIQEIEDILSKHPNAYYGVDAFWGHDQDFFLLFVSGETKDEYLKELNYNFDRILNYAVNDWKYAVERHPDQFVWGIDRGDTVWNYDLDVGRAQVRLARAFIGSLNPEVQERIAYKNAQKIVRL